MDGDGKDTVVELVECIYLKARKSDRHPCLVNISGSKRNRQSKKKKEAATWNHLFSRDHAFSCETTFNDKVDKIIIYS